MPAVNAFALAHPKLSVHIELDDAVRDIGVRQAMLQEYFYTALMLVSALALMFPKVFPAR